MDTFELPAESALRRALRRLCTDSVREPWLVKNHCRTLVDLHVVRARTNGNDPTSEELRDALVSYLDEIIEQLEQEQYQILLRVVMGLDPRYREMKTLDRYIVVGKTFRGRGAPVVTPGTIRQYHVDKAVKALAPLIYADERRHRSTA